VTGENVRLAGRAGGRRCRGTATHHPTDQQEAGMLAPGDPQRQRITNLRCPPNLRQGDFDESQEAKLRAATAALPPPGGEPMRQAPGGFDQPSKHLNKRKLERR
jgi:hypothetical protein